MSFKYEAVLFDWSWTLVELVQEDDGPPLARMFDFMRGRGIAVPDFDAAYALAHEMFYDMIRISRQCQREACFDEVLYYLLQYYGIDLRGMTTTEELLTVYYKEAYAPRRLFPDTLPALERLRAAGVRMGVVSNTTNPPFMKDYERRLLGLDPYFEFTLYSSALPFRKPHPSIFQLALRRLALRPEQVLFVGDDPQADVGGAGAAGLATAWINRDREEMPRNIHPDYEIRSLEDILGLNAPGA